MSKMFGNAVKLVEEGFWKTVTKRKMRIQLLTMQKEIGEVTMLRNKVSSGKKTTRDG